MIIDIKKGYAERRAAKYPTWQEQMDYLFHHGYDAWKDMIQAIKDEEPKTE